MKNRSSGLRRKTAPARIYSGAAGRRDASRPALGRKLTRLERLVGRCGSALVAFSGGVDSTFLLAVARRALGERVIAATVSFPAVPAAEVREARAMARRLGARHVVVKADDILKLRGFAANPPDRCYHCKRAILSKLSAVARERGMACVVEASNTDDMRDYRPGRRAVEELGVRSPLVEAGISKNDIRTLSRALGLPTWSKPSAACLASRIPYGKRITRARLSRIEKGEAFLASLGFVVNRLRDHGEIARIEITDEDARRLLDAAMRRRIVRRLKALGFRYVTFDLEGYRTGSMNEALRRKRL
jgi:uncharacterized protein